MGTLKRVDKVKSVLNILILISSIVLLTMISWDILKPFNPPIDDIALHVQLGICVIFMFDFFFRLLTSERQVHYFARNWLYLLVSIPFANIAHYINMDINEVSRLFLKIIPLIRGAYGFMIVIKWLTKNNITNLLISYLVILSSLVWFSALIFFKFEAHINSGLTDFWDAIWWALMLATTVGSSINAVTVIGQVLSIILALFGMMIFPIFTIYISNKMKTKFSTTSDNERN